MTEQQEAAMRQALDDLKGIHPGNMTPMAEEYWNKAITALTAALEQPAQQELVDSGEKAGAYMEARLWEFIDMAAAWPEASPDPRTWAHVMVYAPKPAQQEPVGQLQEYAYGRGQVLWFNKPADQTMLYTRPPAREWVGIDAGDWNKIAYTSEFRAGADWAEAKLREKNA